MSSASISIHHSELHSIHQQIQLLKELYNRMLPDDSVEAQTLLSTIKIMHTLEGSMTKTDTSTGMHN